RYVHMIRAGAAEMASLIDDMLRLSRVNRDEMRRESIDLTRLARETIERQRAGNTLEIETFVEPGLVVVADAGLLRTALDNLISNALKFARGTSSPRIEVGRDPTAPADTFFVRDNGVGFDMAHASRLFIAFERLHRRDEFEGTGIGLAIVARVMRRHGGTARGTSVPGQGATFFFTIPREVRT
ncbi:MAG TPA: ATP-binding protein, partial [Candidatus Limnocylindrales bacterium]|nr:ATP-binding protein [Candidatus Limnocylindrales bacterium]